MFCFSFFSNVLNIQRKSARKALICAIDDDELSYFIFICYDCLRGIIEYFLLNPSPYWVVQLTRNSMGEMDRFFLY